jgi:protein O-GlcNAc transferase
MNRQQRRAAARQGASAGPPPPRQPSAALFAVAVQHFQAGRLKEANGICAQILAANPHDFDALHLSGLLACRVGMAEAGIDLFRRALACNERVAPLHYNMAEALRTIGRFDDAINHYRHALALAPNFSAAYGNLGSALMLQGKVEDAIAAYQRALAIEPAQPVVQNNLGAALHQQGKVDDALAVFERALATNPSYADALLNRGNLLFELGRYEEARDTYDRVLALTPDYVPALSNRAYSSLKLGFYDEALAGYDRALSVAPDNAAVLDNRGNILFGLGRHEEAAADFTRVVRIQPERPHARGNLLYSRLLSCDWTDYATQIAAVTADVAVQKPAAHPFMFLNAPASAETQLICAKLFADERFPPSPEPLWRDEIYRHDRVRLAYLSADFGHHPVAYALAQLWETHDKTRFETIAISFGPVATDAFGQRLRQSFDRFVDVRDRSDREIAALLREMEVDIAVDLMGYTTSCRPGIFALRPASIQVNFLGYPGTTGADYRDYIIADRIVIPEPEQRAYSEQVAYLPGTFMPFDTTRQIPEHTPTRREAGLPETGFVFCSFNNAFKITPPVFDTWMRLLLEVEGSVLWLSGGSPASIRNRRSQAQQCGVDPDRLIFASRVERVEDHLARHRLAGLFLDTSPYNAHVTAADALWAGLPIITCPGPSFSSRVAASLLHAAGLPELVTDSLAAYETLALNLARDPTRLTGIKAQIKRKRTRFSLFDADGYRRRLESAYATMWQRYERGEPPASFSIPASDAPE